MVGQGLIEMLLGDSKGKEELEGQIQEDFKDGYIEGHRRYAARQGINQAFEDIIESKKPGFFKRGVMKVLEKPQGMNLKANNTFADKRQKLIARVDKVTKKFDNFDEKKLKFRV